MTPDTFRKLAALGLSTDQIAGVLDIMESDAEVRKAKARDRVQRWRDKQKSETQRNVTQHNVTQHGGSREPARVEDNLLTKELSGKEGKKDSFEHEFEKSFWPVYPRKAGKGHARKAFIAARKSGVSLAALVSGAQRYAAERAGEDAKYTKHAAAWIHAESWDDEPIPKHVQQRATAPPEQRTMSDILDAAIYGKPNVPHQGPTIDASVNGADRGSAQNLVRLDAFAARNRS